MQSSTWRAASAPMGETPQENRCRGLQGKSSLDSGLSRAIPGISHDVAYRY